MVRKKIKKCENQKQSKQKCSQSKQKSAYDTYPQLDLVHVDDILEPMIAIPDFTDDFPYAYLLLTPKCDWANLFLAATK